MKKMLSRRTFFKFLGAGLTAISVATIVPVSSFSSKRRKARSKQPQSPLDSEKRAELRKLLREMRIDLRKCKEALIARKKAGKRFGHLASRLYRKQRILRNYHIALSELRGRTRQQIERPRPGNKPDEITIARIKKRFS